MDRLNFRYPEQMNPLSQVVAWSILITLVFGIGAFYASKASAAQEAELWAVAHELIPVAEQYMGRPASGALPDMRIVEADEMPCLCAAVYMYAVDVQPAELGYQQPAELLLRKDMRLDQPLDRSIVLHELIHYLQELAGGPVAYGTPQWIARERVAYREQYRWLRANGVLALNGFGWRRRIDEP